MMKWFKRKKGQNVAEYAILIALVVGAIIAMQKFAQRGLNARIFGAVKYMTNKSSAELGNVGQYVPYYEASNSTTTKSDTETKSGTGDSEEYATTTGSNRVGTSNATIGATNQTITGSAMTF
jgi:hypothetical protein